jgi:hypothetical protein
VHIRQDFFLSENKSLNSSNAESTIIAPNPIKMIYTKGCAGQVLHEDMKRRRYHIMPIDKMILQRDPSTAHSGGASVPAIVLVV